MADDRKTDPERDEIRARLGSDPSQPPDAIVLTGFVGASGRPGYQRLYLDATLRTYIEVPEHDVRHREHVGSEDSPVGQKTTLWIRRGAPLDYTIAQS